MNEEVQEKWKELTIFFILGCALLITGYSFGEDSSCECNCTKIPEDKLIITRYAPLDCIVNSTHINYTCLEIYENER